MRKLLTILFICFFLINGASQTTYPTYQWFGSANTLTEFRGAGKAVHGFINGVYADTSLANVAGYLRFYPGAQIMAGDSFYLRDKTASRWLLINGSGGGGSSTFVGLTDGPGAFTGQAGKSVRVNVGETALEYFTPGSGFVWGNGTGTLSNQTDLQNALNLKANLASPTFTGTPTLPTGTIGVTQSAGNSTTALATTAFVTTADDLKANIASPTFTGTVTIPTPFTLGSVSVLPTGTELNFVGGVTSSIQTQLDSKQSLLVNSAGLLAALSDETGTGLSVFNTSPLFVTPRLNSTSTTGYVWTATDASGNGSFQAIPSDNLVVQNAGSGTQTWFTSGDTLYMKKVKNTSTVVVTTDTDSSLLFTVPDASITYAKIQNVTQARLLGRYTSSTGVTQEISIGSGLSLDAGTGVLSASGGSGITTLNTLTGATQTFSSTGITITSTGTNHAFSNDISTGIASANQTIIGSTLSGGSLTYSSTSNATKGTHIWGTTSKMVFDEVNNELRVGSSTDAGSFNLQVANFFISGRDNATPISYLTWSNNTTGSSGLGIRTSTDALQSLFRGNGPSIGTTVAGISKNNMTELLSTSGPLFLYGNSQPVYITSNTTAPVISIITAGRVGLNGITSPTAWLHLPSGTATASTAPLKFTSGTNLTTGEAGAMEYNGTNLFFTRSGTTRESVITANSVNSVSPTAPNRTITVVIDGTTYYISAKTTND